MASGNTLLIFTPLMAEPTSTNFATLDTRNNHSILDFDDTTNEYICFSSILPRNYSGGGVSVYFHFATTSGTNNSVDWGGAWEALGAAGTNMGTDSFAAERTVPDTTVPTVTGVVGTAVLTFTDGAQMDSLAAGEYFRFKVNRSTADDLVGDAELIAIEIKET